MNGTVLALLLCCIGILVGVYLGASLKAPILPPKTTCSCKNQFFDQFHNFFMYDENHKWLPHMPLKSTKSDYVQWAEYVTKTWQEFCDGK